MTDHKDLIERAKASAAVLFEYDDAARDIQDLANALEAAQDQCVEVKPLEWAEDLEWRHIGRPPVKFANFAMWVHNFDGGASWQSSNKPEKYASLGEAKAAAQADYEQRILASITTRPASDVWAEATAAAYGAAADIAEYWYNNSGKGTVRAEIEALTPQSARDWLAEREAAIRADERAKVAERVVASKQTYAMALPGSDEEFAGVMFGMQRALDVIRNAALPMKENADE